MARKQHTEEEVLKSIRKKHDLQVVGTTIKILKNKIENDQGDLIPNPIKVGDIGNGTNGKLDFLVKHCGYHIIFVKEFRQ